MATQVENGKAFEWAMGLTLESKGFKIIQNNASIKNKECFNKVSEEIKKLFLKNSKLAIDHILKKEKVIEGIVKFLSDEEGQDGDVRDIVIASKSKTFGISCKTNHTAYKHSRLSDRANFVSKWGLDSNGCSQEYLDSVKKIFGELRAIKHDSNGKALWRDQPNVPQKFYWPVLAAFEKEILRIQSATACAYLVQYLIGKEDFYKVVSRNNRIEITAFNINNNLSVPLINLPDKITATRNENGSQYAKTITFNAGWEFNFRIHNASSRVEPSLKFDITATSLPPKLYQHHIAHE